MTSPSWKNTQLAAYLELYDAVPSDPSTQIPGVTHGAAVAGEKWWAGWRNLNAAPSGYAALSTAPNTNIQPAADTTAGNVVADAGFGEAQQ